MIKIIAKGEACEGKSKVPFGLPCDADVGGTEVSTEVWDRCVENQVLVS